MKALLIVLCLWVSISACQSSKNKVAVPDNIKNAFAQVHPNATDIRWIEEPGIYEAKFSDGTMKGAVSFNEKGDVVETEEVIGQDNLPNLVSIIEYIRTSYPGESIQQCEKITKQDGSIIYELQIQGKELVFNSEGQFLEEEPD